MLIRPFDFYLDLDALLEPLLHPDDIRLLHVEPRPEHVPLIEELAIMELRDILPFLVAATVVGGAVDPGDDRGDVVWAAGLRRFHGDPRGGLRLAHRWFLYLERLGWDGIDVSVVQASVAAYAAALHEHRLGREVRARRWARMAATQTEGEARTGIGLVSYIRARRLLLG